MVVWFWARQEIFLFCSVSRPAVGHPWVYSEVCFSWCEVAKVMKLNTGLYLMPKVRVYGTVLPLAHMLLWHGTYLTLCYTPHTYVDFLRCFFFRHSYLLFALCLFCVARTCTAECLCIRQRVSSSSWHSCHLNTGFSWFPCVYKQMLRWFPRFQVATTCFSCSPPDLNLVVTNFMFCLHVK